VRLLHVCAYYGALHIHLRFFWYFYPRCFVRIDICPNCICYISSNISLFIWIISYFFSNIPSNSPGVIFFKCQLSPPLLRFYCDTAILPLSLTRGGQAGNQCNCSGHADSRRSGSRNAGPRLNSASSRRETRGKSPRTRPSDQSAMYLDKYRSSPSTIQTHSRAYRTIPMRLRSFVLPDVFYFRCLLYTTRYCH